MFAGGPDRLRAWTPYHECRGLGCGAGGYHEIVCQAQAGAAGCEAEFGRRVQIPSGSGLGNPVPGHFDSKGINQWFLRYVIMVAGICSGAGDAARMTDLSCGLCCSKVPVTVCSDVIMIQDPLPKSTIPAKVMGQFSGASASGEPSPGKI